MKKKLFEIVNNVVYQQHLINTQIKSTIAMEKALSKFINQLSEDLNF